MRRTTALSLIFGSLLTGLALGRFGLSAGATAVVCAGVAAVFLAHTRLFVGALMMLALTCGLWRAHVWTADRAELTGLIGHRITVTGVVADDPSANANRQVSFNLTNLQLDGDRPLPGSLSVFEYPVTLQRGYQVRLVGKVEPGYGNAAAELSFPQITTLSEQQSWLEHLRQQFFAGIHTALPEPLGSFGLGLLVGIRALIPKAMQTELALVGLSHLVAVSGYNLTIIVQAVERLLGRFGRGVALVASLWLMGTFLLLTGATSSIVRASLVSGLSLLAGFYGRRFQPLALILIAAGVTAAVSPSYLTDLGWLLSFLAFFGILVTAPAVEARLGHPKPVLVRLLIESVTAQILTIPLIMYIFNQLSIVSPLSNLVILPMVPLAMAVTFVAGLAGMILPAFAGWFAWPASLLLHFMIRTIDAFAALPWAGRTDHLSLTGMLVAYGLIIAFTIALARKPRSHHANSEYPQPTQLESTTA